ncbi:NADH-quinone oxidoreductase subunit C [Streptomyces sp. BI20]|uniref:NADH-quinone oxidoreductase subunit C n=1 Tax=Streptomyces sp. BI20 TaxID=3403460 RepID=UPI003C75B8BC
MTLYDALPDAAPQIFGAEAHAVRAHDLLTVDVPVGSWIPALEIARDKLGCTWFDWLSAVDEPGTGFRICAHVVALEHRRVRRLLLRTTVPHSAPELPTAVDLWAGAAWHERETHEMFGVVFTDHPDPRPLLLPENFEGHPLRKDFVLAARVAKAWPGAKEPGEGAGDGAPKRRQMLPPGVPDPNDWGPLKGTLPAAPTRPARTPRAATAGAEGAPPRRTRSVTAGSASQTPATPTDPPTGPASPEPPTTQPPRRNRTASEGSASQSGDPAAPAARPPRRNRSASEGSASQAGPPAPAPEPARPPRRNRSASDGSASQAGPTGPAPAAPPAAPRSPDAPWHDPKPAFDPDTPTEKPAPEQPPTEEGRTP